MLGSQSHSRDWLFRPECPLCGRKDTEDGADIVPSKWGYMPDRKRRAEVAHSLCWWCVARAASWAYRRHQRESGMTLLEWHCNGRHRWAGLTKTDVIEFTAHVIKRRPKWLGDPNAFHPMGPRK